MQLSIFPISTYVIPMRELFLQAYTKNINLIWYKDLFFLFPKIMIIIIIIIILLLLLLLLRYNSLKTREHVFSTLFHARDQWTRLTDDGKLNLELSYFIYGLRGVWVFEICFKHEGEVFKLWDDKYNWGIRTIMIIRIIRIQIITIIMMVKANYLNDITDMNGYETLMWAKMRNS